MFRCCGWQGKSRLVASFRATLAEALDASLLLLVVDASDPTCEAQLEVTRSVLGEIGADAVPSRLLLNKIDRVGEVGRAALLSKHPEAILLSARSAEDVAALRETIVTFFESAMVEEQLTLPYAKQDCSAMFTRTRSCSRRTSMRPAES